MLINYRDSLLSISNLPESDLASLKIQLDVYGFQYNSDGTCTSVEGINTTVGIPIIRVSVDHGTAYDIVGKKIGNIKGLINCVNLIKKIYKNRKKIANS